MNSRPNRNWFQGCIWISKIGYFNKLYLNLWIPSSPVIKFVKTKFSFWGVWLMFSIQFLKPFPILESFFKKIHFLTPLTPLFWKDSKFWLFLKIFFGDMWHMFSIQFLKPFSILELFFQKNCFLTPLNLLFWKKLKILSFFENLLWGHVAHV